MNESREQRNSGDQTIPISAVNQFLYCGRRAGLIYIEGVFEENEHTAAGSQAHERVDAAGYETVGGVEALRALPIWSERLRLSGRADIVEARLKDPSLEGEARYSAENLRSVYPVEYKRGRRRQYDNDDAQLCAQALCLEEMFGMAVPAGAVFHAASRRRREVEITDELRRFTEEAVEALHQLIEGGEAPRAELKPQCSGCSLHAVCMPEVTGGSPALERIRRGVFDVG